MDISVIVPVYNEELVVRECHRRLTSVLSPMGLRYEIIFVNDGSRDQTAEIVRGIAKEDKNVRLLSFARNFGHQTAITAGMDTASGAAVITIDSDLQDPPELIAELVAKWREGYDIIYARRTKRRGESAFKRVTAGAFYRILNSMCDVEMPVDVGDYRLISRRVCDALKAMPERNRYVRGLVSWVGFKQGYVDFVREERLAGETKYPLKKMMKLAFDGLTSFSLRPLKAAYVIGFAAVFLGLAGILVCLVLRIFWGMPVLLASLLWGAPMMVNGGVLITIGILGEYVGRIYDEARGRPLYIIGERAGFEDDSVD